MSVTSVTSAAIQITLIDLISKGLSGIKGRMRGLARAGKETQAAFDKMVKSGKYAATSAVVTRQMYRGLKPAVGLAGDLQAELIGTRAELTKAGKEARQLEKEMAAIKKTAFAVQAWTPFDMGQIVALEKGLTKAGANVKDVVGDTGAAAAAAALAVYEGLDPLTTGKALIGIGTPFKIGADRYMELADNISRAASASTTSAAEIAEAAKYAAGTLAALGKSSKEMLILTAMMAQAGVTGSMAGTGIKNFFLKASSHKAFRDASGDPKKTIEIIELLRTKLGKLGKARQVDILKKIFGEEGMPLGLAFLNEGKGSYEDLARSQELSASLQDKLNLSMGGFNKQLESLAGTSKSTIAQLFTPALAPLTAVVKKTNEFMAALGKAAIEKKSLGKAVSGLSLGAVGAGGLATAGLGAAGLFYGRKVLKGVGGLKGLFKGAGATAAGIATGKAVEAATGVQPVFVTNWPAGGLGGGPAGAAASTARGSAASLLKKAGGLKGLLKMPVGTVGKGTTVAAGAGALAAGYGIGTLINKGISAVINKTSGGRSKDLGELIYDVFHSAKKQKPRELSEQEKMALQVMAVDVGRVPDVKNDVALNIQIDKNDRAFVETGDMNTRTSINVKRAEFF